MTPLACHWLYGSSDFAVDPLRCIMRVAPACQMLVSSHQLTRKAIFLFVGLPIRFHVIWWEGSTKFTEELAGCCTGVSAFQASDHHPAHGLHPGPANPLPSVVAAHSIFRKSLALDLLHQSQGMPLSSKSMAQSPKGCSTRSDVTCAYT